MIFDDLYDLRDIVLLYKVEERRAARQQQQHVTDIVASLGGDARPFRRERAKRARALVAEFYSSARVSALATNLARRGAHPPHHLGLDSPRISAELAARVRALDQQCRC